MKTSKLSVLLEPDEADRFDQFCRMHGYKKSTLVARLIRDWVGRSENGAREPRPSAQSGEAA
jgi:hypothetical protein